MKKIISIIALSTTIGSAYAVQRPIYPQRPMPIYNPYQAGYNAGYNKGKKDHQEKVVKFVAGAILVTASGIILYNVLKPSENYSGHVQLARF